MPTFVIEKIVVEGVHHGSERIVAAETLLAIGRGYTETQLQQALPSHRAASLRRHGRLCTATGYGARALRAGDHGRGDDAGLPGRRVGGGRDWWAHPSLCLRYSLGRRADSGVRRALLLPGAERGHPQPERVRNDVRPDHGVRRAFHASLRDRLQRITTCSADTSSAPCLWGGKHPSGRTPGASNATGRPRSHCP